MNTNRSKTKKYRKQQLTTVLVLCSMLLALLVTPISRMDEAYASGSPGSVSAPEIVGNDDIAPSNYLSIVDNMPSAKVEILGYGQGHKDNCRLNNPKAGNSIWGGEYKPHENEIFDKLHGNGYGGYTIQFQGSNQWAPNYTYDENAGWNTGDLSLDTTTMWVKVKYTNAAYYKGELVDAIAVIKVTPMKNRTPGAAWGNATYQGQYYPLIQISDVLYRGWNWQNVSEINVDLQLLDKETQTPIHFNAGAFGDFSATYYTINSLNEASIQGGGESPAAAYGPEYVVPKEDTVSNAYVIPGSHIKTSYNGDHSGTQHAYNGGFDAWDGDDPSHPNWSQNSVLFTTADTDHLNFTMGNLERDPVAQNVKRTNFVWTSISTQSFTNHYVKYIDIPVEKRWSDQSYNNHNGDVVEVELHYKYYKNGQRYEKEAGKIFIDADSGWKGTFYQKPDPESLRKLIAKQQHVPYSAITGVEYFIKEKTVDGYQSAVSVSSQNPNGFVIDNTKLKSSLQIKKQWYVLNHQGNLVLEENFHQEGDLRILLKRKLGNTIDTDFSRNLSLKEIDGWSRVVDDLEIHPLKSNGTYDLSKKYTYFIEEDQSSLPEGFILKEYVKKETELQENQQSNILTVSNKEIPHHKILIEKVDYDNGGPLPNVAFSLYNKKACTPDSLVKAYDNPGLTGNKVSLFLTNQEGKTGIYGLAPGTYYLKEVGTIGGYMLLEEPISITVAENGTISGTATQQVSFVGTAALVKVKDYHVYTLPNSGGRGIYGFLIVGGALVALAVLMMAGKRRKLN